MQKENNQLVAKEGLEILFRENEIRFLTSFIGPQPCSTYPFLFLIGHTSTGKTLVLSKLMKFLDCPHVWINCHETFNSLSLFKTVSEKLSAGEDGKKVKNVCDFVGFLKTALKDAEKTTFLVFDAAEMLLNNEPWLLPVLSKLQDLTRVKICTIFISEIPWMRFRSSHSCANPRTYHFSNYTKDQMSTILQLDRPEDYDVIFYEGYVNVIMKTFYTVTTNISELRHLARINFGKYCEPLDEDSDSEVSTLRLFKNIEPTLREAMKSVYLREISGTKWSKTNSEAPKNILKDKYSATRELPFYSKFLLLAAYFASYNPPKSDFKHFVKNQGKQSKKRIARKAEKNRHLLGPKAFSLDRLLSIFFSIVGECVLPSALIYSQISSLVSMRLLDRVSADEQLDCPKYKCLAELVLISKIGKTVSIDVMGYLDDFL